MERKSILLSYDYLVCNLKTPHKISSKSVARSFRACLVYSVLESRLLRISFHLVVRNLLSMPLDSSISIKDSDEGDDLATGTQVSGDLGGGVMPFQI